jgi:hypothetical protein
VGRSPRSAAAAGVFFLPKMKPRISEQQNAADDQDDDATEPQRGATA